MLVPGLSLHPHPYNVIEHGVCDYLGTLEDLDFSMLLKQITLEVIRYSPVDLDGIISIWLIMMEVLHMVRNEAPSPIELVHFISAEHCYCQLGNHI